MNQKNKKSKRAIATGVFAAIAASSCCIPPVIAAIAGVGGASASLSWMTPFRPYLIALAILAIGYAWYNHLKQKKEDDCGCENEKAKWYQTKGFLIGMTAFAIISIGFPYYSGLFFTDTKKEIVLTNNSKVKIAEIEIEGMTCDACQHHVNQAVQELNGIIEIQSSYANGNAIIEFDNSQIAIEEIEKAVNSTGYIVVSTAISTK